MTASGRCACGSVQYQTKAALRPVWNCHCDRCRRHTGHFMAATAVAASELEVDGDTLRWWEIPGEAAYGFCATCGSTVLWRPADGDHISIAAGTLDTPTGLSTAGAIFCDQASDYHRLDPDLPQVPGDGTL